MCRNSKILGHFFGDHLLFINENIYKLKQLINLHRNNIARKYDIIGGKATKCFRFFLTLCYKTPASRGFTHVNFFYKLSFIQFPSLKNYLPKLQSALRHFPAADIHLEFELSSGGACKLAD